MNKFEMAVVFGMMLGWAQLMFGFTHHAFYTLGVMMTICLLAIVGYLQNIYTDK